MHRPGPGPGSSDNAQVLARFRPGSNDRNQTFYRTSQAFSGHFFNKEQVPYILQTDFAFTSVTSLVC
jgi:hypothetical protein